MVEASLQGIVDKVAYEGSHEDAPASIKMTVKDLDLYYGDFHALSRRLHGRGPANQITAFIGPSGCGKSTLLRTLNRMNDLVDGAASTAPVMLDGNDIYGKDMDVDLLRRRIGMVFQKPNPFPMSVYENVAFGPRTQGVNSKRELDEIVEDRCASAAIWEEVKDRLTRRRWRCPAASSSACASPARWRSSRTSC